MATGQSQTSERGGVGAQLVGDQQFRHEALLLQQFADQLLQSLLQVGIDPDTAFSSHTAPDARPFAYDPALDVRSELCV